MSDRHPLLSKLDLIVGWVAFAIATLVYVLTLEPTASWWDCGQFIAAANKLQVTHPPGAPLYLMIGRIFTLFAGGNSEYIAFTMNLLAALSSSATIMFLFWSITMLAEKIAKLSGEITDAKVFAILGSGFVGAMAFTFSDSFWFSAVESEVYSMSSFFTALVFWAILRWERVAGQPHHLRWLLFIAYCVGLSIGVHLLNLLAIPAIAFIFYFKRYQATRKGVIITSIFSVMLLFFILNIFIPMVVKLDAQMELLFVNEFGLPFNSGTIVYYAAIIGLLTYGIRYTHRRAKVFANTVLLSLTFILIGYSTFLIVVIRANANPPQNMNNPSDAMTLLSYLGREQYGDWPLLYGPYFNAPLDRQNQYSDGTPVYRRDTASGRYIMVDDRRGSEPNFDDRFKTIFPRMWSNQRPSHPNAYRAWADIQGVPVEVVRSDGTTEILHRPTFAENLRFFFRYQIGHMYFRYFMWNFVGRQNDIEGHGSIAEGNWISGINFIDRLRVGDQTDLPPSMENSARNKFYFLPLILGLIGLYFHFKHHKQDAFVVLLLFLMTGLAIIVYLNQTPLQPRERDYSYVGSFYAFAIWIGLGVMAIWNMLQKYGRSKLAAILVTAVCLVLVPGILAKEGWDDHDRSGRYVTRDFAYNYLISCNEDAVLITFGDNDTFPLWYIQDVENVRTDIRVANHMLASGDWYVHQLMRKVNDSPRLPFTLSSEQYGRGTNDVVYFVDRNIPGHVELKDLINFIASDADHSKITLGGERFNFFPTKRVQMTINPQELIASGAVPAHMADSIVPKLKWEIQQNHLFRNDLAMLDFLATNNWKRPFYFTSPGGVGRVLNLDEYMHLEGFVYRLLPVKAPFYVRGLGGINVDVTFDVLMNRARWGNINHPDVTVDRESMRNSMFPRQNFMRLAQALLELNRIDSAVMISDRYFEIFPNSKFPHDLFTIPFAEVYYEAGDTATANQIMRIIADNTKEEIAYFDRQTPSIAAYFDEQRQRAFTVLQRIGMMARLYEQRELQTYIDDFMRLRLGRS